jgi:serine/threonine protein kinase
MGNYLSSAQPLPDLPDELIEQIIKQTPTITLFASAIYVNKKWNDIGRRNAIWIPRYKQLTGETLNPAKYAEYAVFPLFMEEWNNRTPIYVDQMGQVTEKPDTLDAWVDLQRKDMQAALAGKPLRVSKDRQELQLLKEESVAREYKDVGMLVTKNLKEPRILYLVRKAGQRAQLEEDDQFYIVSPQNDLLGARVIVVGQGSFNCAVLVEDDDGSRQVVRIAALDNVDAWTLRAIPRGAAIVHLFAQYARMLGPALLRETRTGFYSDKLPQKTLPFVCPSVAQSPGPFYVHTIEYLEGGQRPTNRDSREAQAFPLVWFLHVARQHFGFRHGDLKRGNIVFRTYDPPQRFTFRYNNRYTYSYEFTKVPVIIDYDFASLHGEQEANSRLGTPVSVPPEGLWQTLHLVMGGRGNYERMAHYDDWWSLGVVLFDYWVGVAIDKWVAPFYADYAEMIWVQQYCQPPSKFKAAIAKNEWLGMSLMRLLGAYVLVRGIYEPGEMPEPPAYLRDTVYSPCVQKAVLDKIPTYGIMVNPFQRDLLRQLLSWNPRERGQDLLKRHFSETIGYFPDFSYEAARTDTFQEAHSK